MAILGLIVSVSLGVLVHNTTLDNLKKRILPSKNYQTYEKSPALQVKITGRVCNIDNNPLEGVKINLFNKDGSLIKSISSDVKGFFKFTELGLSLYFLIFQLEYHGCPETIVDLTHGGERLLHINMLMRDHVVIKILERNGQNYKPIVGVMVRLSQKFKVSNHVTVTLSEAAALIPTDSKGEIRVTLNDGEYFATETIEGYLRESVKPSNPFKVTNGLLENGQFVEFVLVNQK